MGDMKTPDFDDLLAAFDIPDMVDPKAAIESGHHDDHDSQLKQPSGGVTTNEDEAHNSSTGHDVGVSVIVKNIRNMDTSEHGCTTSEKDGHFHSHSVSIGNGPHNSFLPTLPAGTHYKKNGWTAPREDGHPVTNSSSTLNQFSPISSAEEFDDDDKIEVDDPVEKQGSQAYFRSTTKKEEQNPKSPGSLDNISKPTANRDLKPDQNNNNNATLGGSKFNSTAQSSLPEEEPKEIVLKSESQGCKEAGEPSVVSNVCSISQIKVKSSAKLSSCIAAIAARSAKKASATDSGVLDSPTTQKEFIQANENPKAPEKPQEQESALEFAKRLLSRQPDSPSSVTSEGETSKGSPTSSTDTTPVIPKVRIKTIKTSTGQIKRTVTRVLPEFDLEGLKRGDSSNSTSVLATTSAIFSSPTRSTLPTTVVATSGGPSIEITKQVTIKPVATAFLPVSAVKTAGSQVINLKLANNTTVKATVIPAASVQSASSAILKAANAIQQQTVMVPASSLANAKLLSKTVHLSNLNLLPQTVSSAAYDLQRALSSSKQSQHQQSQQHKIIAGQPSKKVSRVKVFTSSQSSVVDAFNKVLSSLNPVPVYVPNLSPPTSACISLPSRGYKCLECGDSFALEKSLTQHYERRSVRIEVTCNHCAKSLVFYNKCSLLSHARGHKDKGVVMQCSHLILKPIPADQMITTSGSSGITTTTTTSTSQAQAPAGQIPGKVAGGGSQTTVISAPCSAPNVAAMPLEDDASKLCRHSLKCLECNEMFQDDNLLAMHYQQAPESNGQKTCTICQMLLPNQCSFLSHQRIHQHKSPYICPECGASCRSVHFQSHVTKNCLHYTRRVGYRVIHKCSMCDTVFTLQSLLYTHFDQHIVNHKVSVFKCPDCSMHYAQKQLMLDHIKAIHGTLKTIEGPPNLGINLPLSTKPTNLNSTNSNGPVNNNKDGGNVNVRDKGEKALLKKTNCSSDLKNTPGSGYTCGDCNTLFNSREVYVAHMRRDHGKILKKHPCRQCDKSFSSSHSLCRHNRLKHKGLRKVYTCPHCPALSQPFTKRVLLDQHIQLMHGVKDPEGKTANSDNMDVSSAKKTVFPKRKPQEDEGSPGLHSRGSDSQPLKRLKVNILKVHKCAVCGFTTEDIAAFHKHIPQHKSDGSSYQCQECGLCYTSHRSLARHLFIVHRLKEPQGLARYNGRGKDDDESQRENQLDVTDENDDGTPNTKCKVCGKLFETEGNLNTHMRTHGMAFIKSKRLSAAEK
ncbi:zinc finger protein 532 isoform X2 [Scomber scombrus]|uniref:zinc finger protein 532 isoform X2 n=1 Tax=Scomber scombrus TaxID=13677 RepID=UPI002DD87D1E|nr:zinc finger protein 532 isoform X2 [Scomber scombrus]